MEQMSNYFKITLGGTTVFWESVSEIIFKNVFCHDEHFLDYDVNFLENKYDAKDNFFLNL